MLMDRALPRPLDWRWLLVVPLTLSAILAALVIVTGLTRGGWGFDWDIYAAASQRLDGGLYDWQRGVYVYRYSPLFAVVFGLIAPLGYFAWAAAHFAALLALPRMVALLAVTSWPFWDDVYNGNLMTFVFVAAWKAVEGSRLGTVAFLILAVLIPRPLMLPVLAWVLWQRREWIIPSAAIAVASLLGALATGWLDDWIMTLLDGGNALDYGPAALIGMAWVPIGAVLAVWLTIRGRLGLASLAISPYWLPPYLLMVLLAGVERAADEDDRVARG